MKRAAIILFFLLPCWVCGLAQAATMQKDTAADQPYLLATTMPQFPGGSEAMIEFIQEHLEYPEAEKKANIQGTIMMQFIVEKDGSLSDIKAVKSVEHGKNLEKEAERVIKLMPKWTPGIYENKNVRVYKNVPFYFVLAPRKNHHK